MKKVSKPEVDLVRVESKGVFAVRDILAQFERLTRRAQDAERKERTGREYTIRMEAALAEISRSVGDLNEATCTKKRVREIVDRAINYKGHYPCF